MNVKRCAGPEGHYFDTDLYATCPHCGAGVAGTAAPSNGQFGNNSGVKMPEKPSHTLWPFGKGKKKQNTGDYIAIPGQGGVTMPNDGYGTMPGEGYVTKPGEPVTMPTGGNDSEHTIPLQIGNGGQPANEGVTVPIWHDGNPEINVQQDPGKAQHEYGNETDQVIPKIVYPTNPEPIHVGPVPEEPKKTEINVKAPVPEKPQTGEGDSLTDIVKEASANEEGKTMGYFGIIKEQSSAAPRAIDPVVGWLVCLEGEYQGDAFKIASGINAIGRGTGNKIVLERDMSVSREKHALITFEPKHRDFYLKPGDSSGLTYLNGEYITDTKKLSKNDKIEIGGGTYLFIPLCDEAFSWDEYIKR